MGLGPLTEAEANQLKLTTEDPQTECRRVFQEAAPEAARELVRLAKFGSNERIKLQAILHVLDRAMGRVQDTPPKAVDDPYREMMQDISTFLHKEQGAETASQDDDLDPAVGFDEGVRIVSDELHVGRMRDIYKDMEQ